MGTNLNAICHCLLKTVLKALLLFWSISFMFDWFSHHAKLSRVTLFIKFRKSCLLFIHSYIFVYLVLKCFLHSVIWYQVFLSSTKNLYAVVWFQVFLYNANNYIVFSNNFYLIIKWYWYILFSCAYIWLNQLKTLKVLAVVSSVMIVNVLTHALFHTVWDLKVGQKKKESSLIQEQVRTGL